MQGIQTVKGTQQEQGELTSAEYATLTAAKRIVVYSTSLSIICLQNKLNFMALTFLLKAVRKFFPLNHSYLV